MIKRQTTRRPPEEDLVLDTSRMSAGKRDAMEVAEAAREQEWEHPSFAQQLFMGRFDPSMLCPFPEQSAEDRRIGDALTARLQHYLAAHLDPEEVDATRTIPEPVMKDLFAMGLFALKVPREYDGLDLSMVNYNRVMTTLASWCGSLTAIVSAHQSIGVPVPLKMFGTEAQKKRFLPRFRRGALSGFALTEPEVGSDPARMATEAVPTPDGRGYILNGEKLWCTNGLVADVMVVMAKTPPRIVRGRERKQITAFLVEKDMPGVEVVHRSDFMGIRAIQNGLLRFHDVRVPKENVIGGEGKGLKLALITLNAGRLSLPAACTGMAKQCLSIVRRWGNERVQWGLEIGRHEIGRRRIVEIAAATLAMEAMTLLASHWVDRGGADVRIEAAMAKLFCSETAWRVIDETLQFRGGRGYERAASLAARGEAPYPVERMMRDCRINRIVEGTSEIMKLFLAREAMDPHLKVAAALLRKHLPLGARMRAGLQLAAHYGRWYPAQWVNASLWTFHRNMGPLAPHFCFLHTTAHKLARTVFHFMGLYQGRLERKQLVLGHLVDIGTELFAMAATCGYARQLAGHNPEDDTPTRLADVFCRLARHRIAGHFRALSENDARRINPLARRLLAGELRWLEEGIVPVGPDEGAPA